jgi:hypothetical protein
MFRIRQRRVDWQIGDRVEDAPVVRGNHDPVDVVQSHRSPCHMAHKRLTGKALKRLVGESGRTQTSGDDTEDLHGQS